MGMDTGHQQNQQHFNATTDNSGGLQQQQQQHQNGNHAWKPHAGDLRRTLLTRLHQALQEQGNPNAVRVAESVEINRRFSSVNKVTDSSSIINYDFLVNKNR